jgi:surface antigen
MENQAKNIAKLAVILGATALVAGCARMDIGTSRTTYSSSASATASAPVTTPTVSATPSDEFQSGQILAFIKPEAATMLSAKETSEAASAQYYALQFGRVGAFRTWQGDSEAKGEVTVGPYIKVNGRDCREFTHTVIIGGKRYVSTGTACRASNGEWKVETV